MSKSLDSTAVKKNRVVCVFFCYLQIHIQHVLEKNVAIICKQSYGSIRPLFVCKHNLRIVGESLQHASF